MKLTRVSVNLTSSVWLTVQQLDAPAMEMMTRKCVGMCINQLCIQVSGHLWSYSESFP